VVSQHENQFQIETLTTHLNANLVLEQAKQFRPQCVVITGDVERELCDRQFNEIGIELLWGKEGLLETAGRGGEDLVVNALVGGVGLEATMRALKADVSIALANKEVLVMAGETVTREVQKRGLELLPIDSEHSAIFQCLQGEEMGWVRRILLTASGGPFLHAEMSQLDHVTVEEALAHPNWSMGKKVTIDSATMMNKALEVIEARWLFDMAPEKVRVVIHPQSIIHSMVEFSDGSIKAQLGVPDMRIPISYALSYPRRWPGDYGVMDFSKAWELTFLTPDMDRFPALRLAYQVLDTGGTAPAVLNAADEVAVDLFLSGRIGFSQISRIVEDTIRNHDVVRNPSLDEILEADRWAREFVMKEFQE